MTYPGSQRVFLLSRVNFSPPPRSEQKENLWRHWPGFLVPISEFSNKNWRRPLIGELLFRDRIKDLIGYSVPNGNYKDSLVISLIKHKQIEALIQPGEVYCRRSTFRSCCIKGDFRRQISRRRRNHRAAVRGSEAGTVGVLRRKDVFAILPTGYGKSLIDFPAIAASGALVAERISFPK